VNRKNLFLAVLFGSMIGCGGANGAGSWSSGDRVLVAKCLYDTHASEPRRYDVVVFKFPQAPVDKGTPKNYIKRLIGLPGEIIAIFFGRLYRWAPQDGQELPFRKDDEGVNPNQLWQHTHSNDPFAQKLFEQGQFQILRKPPEVMMALRRIVYDNDFQPSDLVNVVDPRWNPAATKGWRADGGKGFIHKDDNDTIDWLRYQHLVVERSSERPVVGNHKFKPHLITDRMGYNSAVLSLRNQLDDPERLQDETPALNWVSDLMLECNLDVEKAQGEFIVELSKSIYRYQARWNLADGVCTLVRIGGDGKEENLDSKATRLKGPGSYLVRFANFDSRLTVWVDRELPFDEGCSYSPPEVWAPGEREKVEAKIRATFKDEPLVENALANFMLDRRGPTENDLQPASVGSKGAAVAVKHVRLWRDTYYTLDPRWPDYRNTDRADQDMPKDAWSNPHDWEPLKKQPFRTLYVQPGHYLCLGDNSTASSDGREWGLVPQRLLLGRALAVYFPIHRLGPIR
jgi:signal peptidase I